MPIPSLRYFFNQSSGNLGKLKSSKKRDSIVFIPNMWTINVRTKAFPGFCLPQTRNWRLLLNRLLDCPQ